MAQKAFASPGGFLAVAGWRIQKPKEFWWSLSLLRKSQQKNDLYEFDPGPTQDFWHMFQIETFS